MQLLNVVLFKKQTNYICNLFCLYTHKEGTAAGGIYKTLKIKLDLFEVTHVCYIVFVTT